MPESLWDIWPHYEPYQGWVTCTWCGQSYQIDQGHYCWRHPSIMTVDPLPKEGIKMVLIILQALVKFQKVLVDNYGQPINLVLLQAFNEMMDTITKALKEKS